MSLINLRFAQVPNVDNAYLDPCHTEEISHKTNKSTNKSITYVLLYNKEPQI